MAPRKTKDGFKANFMSSAAFAKADFHRDWLVEGILVRNEPCLLGGPKKCLKTSVAVDLALSLGSGTPFLGAFKVPVPAKVVMLSAESGQASLQDTAQRICRQKGIQLEKCLLDWHFDLPKLDKDAEVEELVCGLRRAKAAAVVFDPLYLALGEAGARASNLFEVGPVLRKLAAAIQDVGCTPILIHHATKAVKPGEPMQLGELSYSGSPEFARQWLLINRKYAYADGSGRHELILGVGGSAGHSGCYDIVVDEGVMRSDFSGRHWSPRVALQADKIDGAAIPPPLTAPPAVGCPVMPPPAMPGFAASEMPVLPGLPAPGPTTAGYPTPAPAGFQVSPQGWQQPVAPSAPSWSAAPPNPPIAPPRPSPDPHAPRLPPGQQGW